LMQSITLPAVEGAGPGLLFAVAAGVEGNIFYSDEINHSVVALDREGKPCWVRTGKGKGMDEFHYPRGLAIGVLDCAGSRQCCLAVADSWNCRVKFLDLAGNVIETWTEAGGKSFGEIADVKFIDTADEDAGRQGMWHVLDKGNHCLLSFGVNGKLVARTGRCFPPALASRWAVPGWFLEADPDTLARADEFPACDALFYPERILGDRPWNLSVVEPGSARIKVVRPPHLLPVSPGTAHNVEWVAGNTHGFLGWQRDSGQLIRFSNQGLQELMEISGVPLASHSSVGEYWLQADGCLQRWLWPLPGAESAGPAAFAALLARCAAAEAAQLDAGSLDHALAAYVLVLDEEGLFAEKILAMSPEDMDPERRKHIADCIQILHGRFKRATTDVHESLHHWCLGVLAGRLAGMDLAALLPAGRAGELRRCYADQLRSRAEKIRRAIANCTAGFELHQDEVWRQSVLAMKSELVGLGTHHDKLCNI
jgi:hypothetical protein